MKKNKDREVQGTGRRNMDFGIEDPIHPAQFWGAAESQRSDPVLPDKKLWAAVLKDAIECFGGRVRGEASRVERAAEIEKAREWFFCERSDIGSFLWVCHVLGLAPEVILKQLDGWSRHKKRAA